MIRSLKYVQSQKDKQFLYQQSFKNSHSNSAEESKNSKIEELKSSWEEIVIDNDIDERDKGRQELGMLPRQLLQILE